MERQNRSILKRLTIAQAEHKNWKEELETYLLMYRSTPQLQTYFLKKGGMKYYSILFNIRSVNYLSIAFTEMFTILGYLWVLSVSKKVIVKS